ncbi:NAD(P)H-flavin reductase (plasmid) [Legionella adelaidensis]|uniref:NAD(P)H-flavin reductase n=1 Tax=Legionella adelaidensis TaxID=45056 RepID=A0A0W0R2M9_9GAMM|nr:NAD(P)H-flavin reductase [Legionella adelaidensis]KTC65319.1 NAD(P)H-flavin reductase [Legionella adelaidensis]VEH86030.1 NAD(P)H-flavin reductase [Legionella adelaidensis]
MINHMVNATIESITPLTDSIIQLLLKPEKYIDYSPGQYLQIVQGKEEYSYSIANAPLGSHKYELHIRHSKGNPYTQTLFAEIKKTGLVKIKVPMGDCHLGRLNTEMPILFVAGGTGFAPIKAMIEQLLANSDQRQFELFWGARSKSDLYMDNKVSHWHQHVPTFRYFSSFSDPDKESLASLILSQHSKDLKNWQIVISGPFDMVYHTRDKLMEAGVPINNLFSDAFSFEKK